MSLLYNHYTTHVFQDSSSSFVVFHVNLIFKGLFSFIVNDFSRLDSRRRIYRFFPEALKQLLLTSVSMLSKLINSLLFLSLPGPFKKMCMRNASVTVDTVVDQLILLGY